MSIFLNALKRKNTARPPVWFMRQAGRYHSHYREIKKKYSFEESKDYGMINHGSVLYDGVIDWFRE